ncbi:MAG: TraB/GumN family protein [Oscillospiraceae bacterium]|jgi:uncharacterized protein YbaP (TraB family)|nr:TraB/GumN family protein [Oscillospiraceae bacterium]
MKRTHRILSLALLVALLLLLAGCARPVGPLLWKVTSPEGRTLHLFGSIHAAEETLYPLPSYVTDAFEQSGALAVEIDLVAFESDLAAQLAFSAKLMYASGETIEDEIGETLAEKARTVLRGVEDDLSLGVPLSMLNMFRPAMWISALESVSVKRAGLLPELGLDAHFLKEAKAAGKEVLEVESIGEQTDMLVGFSAPLQAKMLESAMEVDKAAEDTKTLYSLWKTGNEKTLTAYLLAEDDNLSVPPEITAEYTEAMYTRRNVKMADAAKRYMSEGKNAFFIVGLAHMLGDGGVVDLLSSDGYTVEKLNA